MNIDTSNRMPLAQPDTRPTRVEARMPFILQVTTLTWRYLVTVFRTPAAVIPGLLISVFFLLVYQSTLGGASNFLPGLAGKSYLGFILPSVRCQRGFERCRWCRSSDRARHRQRLF